MLLCQRPCELQTIKVADWKTWLQKTTCNEVDLSSSYFSIFSHLACRIYIRSSTSFKFMASSPNTFYNGVMADWYLSSSTRSNHKIVINNFTCGRPHRVIDGTCLIGASLFNYHVVKVPEVGYSALQVNGCPGFQMKGLIGTTIA